MKRPFLPAGLFMLLALWPMVQMRQSLAADSFETPGFDSPILQAEFHVSNKDVYELYGAAPSDARLARTAQMRQAHYFDNWFLCCYGLFLALFALFGFRFTRKKYFLALILLAVVAAVADFFENDAIVRSTHILDAGGSDFSLALQRLAIFTWLKWLCLAFYFGLLARFFWGAAAWGHFPNWLGKALACGSVLTLLISLLAFGTRDPQWESWMAQAFTLQFGALFLFGVFFRRKEDARGA
jgi:hypothetical protein